MRLLQRGILRRPSRGQPAQLDVDVSAAARGTVLTGHADEGMAHNWHIARLRQWTRLPVRF